MSVSIVEIFNNATVEIVMLAASLALFILSAIFDEFPHKKLAIKIFALLVISSCIYVCLDKFCSKDSIFAFNQLYISNPHINLFKLILSILAFNALLMFKESHFVAEAMGLKFAALLGGFIMLSANNLIPFYLGLELHCICIYVLISLNAKPSKGILRYFFLGLLSSAIVLYGMSILYGSLATTDFSIMVSGYTSSSKFLLGTKLGISLIAIGLIIKLFTSPANISKKASKAVSELLWMLNKPLMALVLLKFFWSIYLIGWNR